MYSSKSLWAVLDFELNVKLMLKDLAKPICIHVYINIIISNLKKKLYKQLKGS